MESFAWDWKAEMEKAKWRGPGIEEKKRIVEEGKAVMKKTAQAKTALDRAVEDKDYNERIRLNEEIARLEAQLARLIKQEAVLDEGEKEIFLKARIEDIVQSGGYRINAPVYQLYKSKTAIRGRKLIVGFRPAGVKFDLVWGSRNDRTGYWWKVADLAGVPKEMAQKGDIYKAPFPGGRALWMFEGYFGEANKGERGIDFINVLAERYRQEADHKRVEALAEKGEKTDSVKQADLEGQRQEFERGLEGDIRRWVAEKKEGIKTRKEERRAERRAAKKAKTAGVESGRKTAERMEIAVEDESFGDRVRKLALQAIKEMELAGEEPTITKVMNAVRLETGRPATGAREDAGKRRGMGKVAHSVVAGLFKEREGLGE